MNSQAVLRLLIGFAVAPLVAGAAMFLISLIAWSAQLRVFEAAPSDPLDAAVAMGLGVTVVAMVTIAAGALPALAVIVTRRVPLTFTRMMLVGAVLGQLPFVAIVAGIIVVQAASGSLSADTARLWYGAFGTIRAIVLGVLVGVPSAAAFWAVGLRGSGLDAYGRPDA